MNNITGAAVTGSDFFDRPALVAWLWERIPHANILLTAPRRSGKTSIMFYLRDKPHHSYHGVFINVEGASGPGRMIHMLVDALQEHPTYKSLAKSFFDGAGKLFARAGKVETPLGSVEFGQAIEHNWEAVGQELIKRLQNLDEKTPLLLLIDEFPILLERLRKKGPDGEQEAVQLLHWFRSIRIDPALTKGKVRFVLSGSIGLEGVVSRLGVSKTINDLEICQVDPFTPLEAADLLQRLEKKHGPDHRALHDEHAHKKLLSYLEEPYPYYVQLFYNQVHQAARKKGAPCDSESVESIYQKEMLGHSGKVALEHMNQRLDDALLQHEAHRVRLLLDRVASSTKGISPRDLERILSGEDNAGARGTELEPTGGAQSYHPLRELLLHDGYLREENGRFLFRTQLLRDFWQRHRGIRRKK